MEQAISKLQKMEMDFDERTAKPHLPTIVMPDMLAANAEKFVEEWDRDAVVRRSSIE